MISLIITKYMRVIFSVMLTILFMSQADISVSQAKFVLNVTAGYSQPVGDFNNSIELNDTVAENWPYLMKTGYNIGLTGKLSLNKTGNIKLVFNLEYNGFKNWGDIYSNEYVPPPDGDGNGKGTAETGTVYFLPDVSMINATVGGQYDFNPKSSVNPFAGLDVTANFFNGNFASNPSSDFPKNDLYSETRVGLQLGGGVDFNCNDYIGIICGLKYNMANLFGKSENPSDIASNQVALNDDAGGRNISYLQLYAGVSFYIGDLSAPKKTKK